MTNPMTVAIIASLTRCDPITSPDETREFHVDSDQPGVEQARSGAAGKVRGRALQDASRLRRPGEVASG